MHLSLNFYQMIMMNQILRTKSQECSEQDHKPHWHSTQAVACSTQGIWGKYIGEPIELKLKPHATVVWNKPYPTPLRHRVVFQRELQRQCDVGAMRHLNPEEVKRWDWCFPHFGIPKKNGQIKFMINFQNLNHQLEWREYPLTPAKEIFQSVWSFVYATSFDLNMRCLHINLAQSACDILTVVKSFGFYKCTKLPMGVMPATNIF